MMELSTRLMSCTAKTLKEFSLLSKLEVCNPLGAQRGIGNPPHVFDNPSKSQHNYIITFLLRGILLHDWEPKTRASCYPASNSVDCMCQEAEVIYTDIIFQKNSETIGRSFSFGDWNEYNIAG